MDLTEFYRSKDYKFSNIHWFASQIPVWIEKVTPYFKHDRPYHILEIGSYEGTSTVWMLENLLVHPESSIISIDPCTGNIENNKEQMENVQKNFAYNVLEKFQHKARLIKTYSHIALKYPDVASRKYDLIYVDGDHHAHAALEDAVLSFRMLNVGGLMIFDDFGWPLYRDQPAKHPSTGVNAFVFGYQGFVEVIHQGYQLMVRKIKEIP